MAMRLPLLAALLHPALGTGELTEVIIGSSYEIGHKCVKPAGAVHCPSRLSGIGHLPDEFDIYQLPSGEVCAKRTDYHGGWSVHVRVKCRKASDWEGAGGGEHLQVDIGTNPDSALKCVADPGHVDCDDTVEQIGRTGEWPDKFHIYHEGAQICARRVDHDGGWGLNLILQCRPRRAFAGGAHVQIGTSSDSAVKCVADPGHVHCDDTAEQVGRTGEWPDTFHIYHDGTQICAQRTDFDGGWGLDLVLNCRSSGGGGFGGSGSSSGSGGSGSNGGTGVHIEIGTSPDSAEKCVADPGHVHCDDTAEQVGRTGEWPDTFHIYHADTQICARRTDFDGGWGLDLVLNCRSTGGFGGGGDFFRTEKIKWCCSNKLFSKACPFDCMADGHHDLGWENDKRQWCCRNRGLGCSGSMQPGTPYWQASSGPHNCHLSDNGDYDFGHGVMPAPGGEVGHRYDCRHGNPEMWSQDKSQFCRLWLAAENGIPGNGGHGSNGGVGGGIQDQHTPHNCREGDSSTWHHQKFEFCCVIKGIGCPNEAPLDLDGSLPLGDGDRNNWEDTASHDDIDTAAEKPRPHEGLGKHVLNFDCIGEDPGDFNGVWSPTKQRWCCDKWGLGCEALGKFNCSSGYWNWKKGWSTTKKDYCCKSENKGCVDKNYDCSKAAADISEDGLQWCCENHKYSTACPFDCKDGLKTWTKGFSQAKKGWCCRHQGLACGAAGQGHKPNHHDLAMCHNDADRPQGMVDWCCRELGLCHLKVNFDCQVGLRTWTQWSAGKKQVCCSKVSCSTHGPQPKPDYDEAWYHRDNVVNVHMGESLHAGTKCVTPSEAVACPVEAGNVRDDDYPDKFRVYRKGGQVCADRLDYQELWGLDLVLKCIKLDDSHYEKVHIGSSDSSTKCVSQTSPVSCDDRAAQAGRMDPHPDTFHVYHSDGQICVKRTDSDSLWGVDLVLYCRQGAWSSPYWSSPVRGLEDGFLKKLPPKKPRLARPGSVAMAIVPAGLALVVSAFAYKSCRQQRYWSLLGEEPTDPRSGRTPWLAPPAGDEGAEMAVA